MTKRFFLAAPALLLAWALAPCLASAQDQDLNKYAGCQGSYYCGGPGTPLQSISWGSFTQNYMLTPRNPDQGICVYVTNNNPTSAHAFTLAVSQTGDTGILSFSNQSGRWSTLATVSTNSGAPTVAAATTLPFFIRANAAAKIALQFGGASTQAGSPDTADINITQTSSSGCGVVNPATGQGYNLSSPNTGSSSSPTITVISDATGGAFAIGNSYTNPTANEALMEIDSSIATTKTIYPDQIIISTTATGQFLVGIFTALPTGCGTITARNLKLGSAVVSQTNTGNACTTGASNNAPFNIQLLANTTYTIDLRGYVIPPGGTNGIQLVTPSAITGTVTAYFRWAEK